jgi:hypothetical protein
MGRSDDAEADRLGPGREITRRDFVKGPLVGSGRSLLDMPAPSFYHGRPGLPAPHEVLTRRHGRMAFGHSEITGIQEWFGAVEHGERAMRQVMDII